MTLPSLQIGLPCGQWGIVDASPRRSGGLWRRWFLVLGRKPSSGLRPTVAAGSVDMASGVLSLHYGCASLEVLDALRRAASVAAQ